MKTTTTIIRYKKSAITGAIKMLFYISAIDKIRLKLLVSFLFLIPLQH